MEIQSELVTNIFTVAVGLILVAIIGLLVAFLVHTVRMEKSLDENLPGRRLVAANHQLTRKRPCS